MEPELGAVQHLGVPPQRIGNDYGYAVKPPVKVLSYEEEVPVTARIVWDSGLEEFSYARVMAWAGDAVNIDVTPSDNLRRVLWVRASDVTRIDE